MKLLLPIISIAVLLIGNAAWAGRKSCEDLATRKTVRPAITTLLDHSELMPQPEQEQLALEIWERRYSIIARELDDKGRLQYLTMPAELKTKVEQLFRSYIRVVVLRTKRLHEFDGGLESADLISEAYYIMIRCLRAYNPTLATGISFRKYYLSTLPRELRAYARVHASQIQFSEMYGLLDTTSGQNDEYQEYKEAVRGELYNPLSLNRYAHRAQTTMELGPSVTHQDLLKNETPSALDIVLEKEFLSLVSNGVEGSFENGPLSKVDLEPLERAILQLRFFSDPNEEMSMPEATTQLGVARQHGYVLQNKAIEKIRLYFQRRGLL